MGVATGDQRDVPAYVCTTCVSVTPSIVRFNGPSLDVYVTATSAVAPAASVTARDAKFGMYVVGRDRDGLDGDGVLASPYADQVARAANDVARPPAR
jgi:hypothetical protein